MFQFLGQITVALIVGALSAWIGATLALQRFRSEKWWEKKADAYTTIIDAIFVLLRLNDTIYDHIVEHDDGVLSEPAHRERSAKYKAAREELRRLSAIGTFVMSEASEKILNDLEVNLESVASIGDFTLRVDSEGEFLSRALESIRVAAKEDMDSVRLLGWHRTNNPSVKRL